MYPKKVQIEPTNYCNLSCTGCMREVMTRPKGFIHLPTFLKALDLCKDFGVEEIHLHHWGEPMMHPFIWSLISIAKSRNFRVGFTTNATLLDECKLIKLKNSGLDKLDISYDLTRKSKRHLKKLYKISNELGIDTWFRTVVWSDHEYEVLKKDLEGYKVRFQRGMYFNDEEVNDKVSCKALDVIFIINWDGVITPCCSMYDNQYIYGKIGNITADELKKKMDILKRLIKFGWVDCCNHCFEVDSGLSLKFKL